MKHNHVWQYSIVMTLESTDMKIRRMCVACGETYYVQNGGITWTKDKEKKPKL